VRRATLIELTIQLRSVRPTSRTRTDRLRIAPYSAVQFTAYEQFKKLLTAGGTRELNTPLRLSAGALAGICSVCSTYPLDLVRSRLSIATATIGKGKSSIYTQRDLSIVGMTLKVYREEGGLRGLYRGVAMTALVRRFDHAALIRQGVAPYVGINFAAYEALRGFAIPPGESQPSTVRKLGCVRAVALCRAHPAGCTSRLDIADAHLPD